MRLAKHVKIITSHLENLEDLKSQLGDLLDYIKNIMNEGTSWIDETKTNLSFIDINHFLISETSNCIQKCLNIANENEDATKLSSNSEGNNSCSDRKTLKDDKKNDDIQIKLDEIEKLVLNHSTEIKQLNKRLESQKNKNKYMLRLWTNTDKKIDGKFEEIMKEFTAASDFMSNLQSEHVKLTNDKDEQEMKLDCMIQKFEEHEEKIILTTKSQELRITKLESGKQEIENNINSLLLTVHSLKKDFESLQSDIIKYRTTSDQILEDSMKRNDVYNKRFDVKNSISFASPCAHRQSSDFSKLKNVVTSQIITFSVGLTTTIEVLKGSVVKYDKLYTNIGDGYNVSSGVFTCPLDGLYVFHVGIISPPQRSVALNLYKNSDYKVSVYAYAKDLSGTGGNTVILHLKQNNTVYLITERDTALPGDLAGVFNTFSGFLICAD